MFKRGVLILGAGRNAIRFAPPLVLTKDQADTIVVFLRSRMETLRAVTRLFERLAWSAGVVLAVGQGLVM